MIDFALVTLNGTTLQQDVYEVIVPTPQGYIALLPHHVPLVSLVSSGALRVRRTAQDRDDQLQLYAISGGVIEVLDNQVRVLVDEADAGEDINEKAAEQARNKAQELLSTAKTREDIQNAREMLAHESARIHVAELRRRIRPRR